MLYLDLLLSGSALLCLCSVLVLYGKVPAGLAPLTALGCVSIWFTLAGIADVLVPAGWVGYLLCWGLGAVAMVRRRSQLRRLISWGSVVFWSLAVLFGIYFSIRQPMFSDFDEFSFWGTAAQMTSTTGHLYTICESGVPWQVTQNPGLILLSYFVQFFGQFAPFKVYLAYDWLLFACIAALVGTVERANWRLAVPAAVLGWCAPWFFTTYARTIYPSTVYLSAYGDIPAGMLMGGVLAFWVAMRSQKQPKALWAVLPVLALMANIKDNTFPIALVAAGLIALDAFVFVPEQKPWAEGWGKRLGFSALCMAAPMASYMAWSRYIGWLVAQNVAQGGSGATSLSPFSAAIYGTKMLLGQPVPAEYEARRELFMNSLQGMKKVFFEWDVSMLGSGAVTVAFILCLFGAALVLAKTGWQRLRVACWLAASSLGYLAYSYVLALSYGFIFKAFQAQALTDYNRYLYPYYIGWFFAGAALLVWTARQGRWNWLSHGAVLGLAVLMLLRVNTMVLPQFSVLGFSEAVYADQQQAMERARAVQAHVQPDSRIFFVSQGDNGLNWFTYHCYLYPNILDYSGWTASQDGQQYGGGGGTFGLPGQRPEDASNESMYYHAYTAQEFAQLVEESGCDYLFINRLDERFLQSYGSLFADGLSAGWEGQTLLYEITPEGWQPVAMEVPR